MVSKLIKDDQWVWVVIQNPGGNEQFLGQKDEDKGISFIPTFLEKEEAEQGLTLMAREAGRKYEVHAILFDDLSQRAAENGFALFLLNGKGKVLEKIETKKAVH
ncbi:MAG: hypothetical protein J7M30_08465 [Deltaproteobacteria bacterium]|nr:hypothetical protein [Deltaproteobacteria bacterium]